MAQWEGKSKGTALGYRIFVGIISAFGIYPAYFFSSFVSLYFFVFHSVPRRYSYQFFRYRMHYSILRSVWSIYVSFYRIGQVLIDRVIIFSGAASTFTHHSNGGENIAQIAQSGKGGIMLGAHLGNWEIAGHFISRYNTKVNILIYDGEQERLKSYMESITSVKRFNIIPITSDLTHIYAMSEALMRGEIICMHADRYMPGAKTVAVDFLGAEAPFPIGPFQMIKALRASYTIVYAQKAGATHYELYARPVRTAADFATVEDMVRDYATDVAGMAKKYPTQWFNFYDFWAKATT